METIETGNLTDNTLSIRIIEAAKQLFVDHGFKGTTTKMIAKEANVNEATLFRHFKNKEGIFLAITKDLTKHSNSKLESIIESDIPLEEMLFQFGMELYRRIVQSKGVLIVAIIESKQRSELVENVTSTFRSIVEILERKLVRLHDEKKLEKNDFFTVSLMYVESLIGLFIVQTRLKGDLIPMEIERLCRSASKVLVNGLQN
ncbi:biofilm operon icaADBC HTH-type negative transcriptional regulator IcaR [Desulfosporosinus acididurans]|uniref:Biofilm operon icaADBC HTH-type negative transcriptional regulator IcaR n=1 Tax=Desulfosporosinus acididurans TaxID=476652 RepID=A0A0J1FWE4_9FIRM|nr:TetR/AcrR family transcriptional regulator [Desulfosporosinus acididurans]KLU67612.1 biofilm operon icaADBC HTH-type negative transcriptional regulator IcaR [Desulfosporosinus acididurans]